MSSDGPYELSEEQVASALKQARRRGLPDGWTVTLDKRRRRRWISPNGKSCDSIPKALVISQELGLLPPDFKIEKAPSGRKRSASSKATTPAKRIALGKTSKPASKPSPPPPSPPSPAPAPESSPSQEPLKDPGPESDPEHSFKVSTKKSETRNKTVHWDPESPAGRRVGWRIRLWDDRGNEWRDGRVLRYDPISHKHKVQYDSEPRRCDKVDDDNCNWLKIENEFHQCASRFVWAHVKGFAWWPSQVMDCDPPEKEGYVLIDFFASDQVARLRDSLECVRPFDNGKIDSFIAKNRKKRNAKAIKLACEEAITTRKVRNEAACFYAQKAFALVNKRALNTLGRRVQVFRSDVNYPYGDTVVGIVRRYSTVSKKWLLSYKACSENKSIHEASWVNLLGRECNYKVLNKKGQHKISDEDLVPFMYGFERSEDDEGDGEGSELAQLLDERCRNCVEYLDKKNRITCSKCQASFHPGCVDPPPSGKAGAKVSQEEDWLCSRCTRCVGCGMLDIAFGSHVCSPAPKSLTLPSDHQLKLCSTCADAYQDDRFCPNCAHTWDDVRYQKVLKQARWAARKKRSRKKARRAKEASDEDDYDSDSSDPSPIDQVEAEVPESGVPLSWYYPESTVWGYNEGAMLICESCNLWVHAGCAGLNRDEYEETSDGDHPIYSKEFLCRICCRSRCKQIIHALREEDHMELFEAPVSLVQAPNYYDVIKNPMDLQTMLRRAEDEEYLNYAWVRELFELMVLNALTFNPDHTKVWLEAKRFYRECMTKVFKIIGKAAPPGTHYDSLQESFAQAKRAKEKEIERVQQDDTTEKKDLVAGSTVASVVLPPLGKPVDQPSCLVFSEFKMKPVEAYYCSWMECCFACGSSGATDTMLFCVDCGEAFHSFCVNVPIHSMDASSIASWRCTNCKVCQISGDVPKDELQMIYCEMCDRGFSLGLLDPPLKAAPPGLWICGQCVDCKSCGNTSEKRGVKLTHWSRDPEKCYRCGGCKGLIEKSCKGMKCVACTQYWRKDDDDLLECSSCNMRVHLSCDSKALEFHTKYRTGRNRTKKAAVGPEEEKFECISCRKRLGGSSSLGSALRKNLSDQSWIVILHGTLAPHANYTFLELHARLTDEIEWRMRNLWREEYRVVVKEALRLLAASRSDVNGMITKCRLGELDLPSWIGHQATRFIRKAKRARWEESTFPKKEIYVLVLVAKMAAAFIELACQATGLETRKSVRCYSRVTWLLRGPGECGIVDLPVDAVKVEGNRAIIPEEKWKLLMRSRQGGQLLNGMGQSSTTQTMDTEMSLSRGEEKRAPEYIRATPLCGWNEQLSPDDTENRWKDPRSCCLCRTCGDDDAGYPPQDDRKGESGGGDAESDSNEPNIGRMGRLLPMSDGLWVHASCALWSSEVYEEASTGVIHSMEKARSRGSQLKCFGCGRPGATLGCFKANCSCNYHFPCAKACGAVFTTKQQMFCESHTSYASSLLENESYESMSILKVAKEKKPSTETGDSVERSLCSRVGALVVHSLGTIEQKCDGFHSEKYITPHGYVATRIFWSARKPRTRTVYALKIDRSTSGHPVFSIIPGDDPKGVIRGRSAKACYNILIERVKKTNYEHFSHGDLTSKLAMVRKSTKTVYGLNGPQFFGFGLNHIRKSLECSPGVEAVVAPLSDTSPSYRFCYVQPSVESIMDLQRKRAAVAAEKALENASGSARTEGMTAVTRSGGAGRITRALVRSAEEEAPMDALGRRASQEESKSDRDSNQVKYRDMKSVPMEQRLVARRSHIHGWGLFTKKDLGKHDMIVEYMGETVRQCIADKREKGYEKSGIGSCYMFRLDLQRIVDATTVGSMARFMNHCCKPNAYAKVITVDTDLGPEKKIVVFANRDIATGEEITYDYKFPVEDGSLRCTCGAPNCIGRMN